MSIVQHSDRSHAFLSASGAHRWLNCTASPRAEEDIPETSSPYAEEGTKAHEVAESLILRYLARKQDGKEWGYVYSEDEEALRLYVDFVIQECEKPYKHISTVFVEKPIDFSAYVKEGFGTCDTVILRDNELIIIDLKFGKGLRVEAEDNPQLRLYALGAYEALSLVVDFQKITTVIIQPRLDHISVENLTPEELVQWGESIRPIAAEAYEGSGTRNPGSWCQFCKAAPVCSALAKVAFENARKDFTQPDENMTMDEVRVFYEKLPMIKKWASALEDYVKKQAFNGNVLPGHKLVEGRSSRRWSDSGRAEERFKQLGYSSDKYLKTTVITAPQTEELVGKTRFNEDFIDLVVKQPGSPTLVPQNDKRKSLSPGDDFN